ncbi:MAG TPA: hypothetical protein VGV35_15665 [Bryobacteraceae bacterium]|nr:hypothetical protein [Bryobacteraceae bacterium]
MKKLMSLMLALSLLTGVAAFAKTKNTAKSTAKGKKKAGKPPVTTDKTTTPGGQKTTAR